MTPILLQDSLIAFGLQYWPTLTLLLIVVIAAVIITYKITSNVKDTLNKIHKVEEKCDRTLNLDTNISILSKDVLETKNNLHKVEEKYDRTLNLESNISILSKDVLETNSLIRSMVTHLSVTVKGFNATLFISKSPIQLSDVGIKILTLSGCKAYIDKKAVVFVEKMATEKYKSAFDVQTAANTLLTLTIDTDDDFIPVKDYLYQNPIYKIDENQQQQIVLDMLTVINIMTIYLRDLYFTKYPELKYVD